MMRGVRAAGVALGVAAGLVALPAAAGALETESFELDNGLTVVVRPDHRAPTVVSMVWYAVGSSYEHRPVTGISHVVEHMMFKGTETREPGEFSALIAREGGRQNAFTGRDYTGYFQHLAADRLALSFELEADRMHRLVFDPEEFEREMEVVREERRQRVEDSPTSLAFERFTAVTYTANPYRQPVIGWMEDLEAMTLEQAEAWYERWYAPGNATVVVVGDVTVDEVRDLAERTFGEVPAGSVEPAPAGGEIRTPGTRRIEVDTGAEVPLVYLAYPAPSLATAEDPQEAYALMLLAEVLDGGRAARLPSELERRRGIATRASARYSMVARLDTVFSLTGRPTPDSDVEGLEEALLAEVARLREEPPSADELQRAVTRAMAERLYELDSPMEQAWQIGALEATGIGHEELGRFEERLRAVTPEDVHDVARRYLRDDRLTVGVLRVSDEEG